MVRIPEKDHRAQLGGWSPGAYLVTCTACGASFIGDKRASVCADCAYTTGVQFPSTCSIEQIENAVASLPPVECPVTHHFTPGLYIREILMPRGAVVVGQEHRTEHANLILKGSALVSINGVAKKLSAPAIFTSKPGVRKVLFILEDCVWATTHVTEETDLAKLENLLIIKSPASIQYAEDIAALKLAAQTA